MNFTEKLDRLFFNRHCSYLLGVSKYCIRFFNIKGMLVFDTRLEECLKYDKYINHVEKYTGNASLYKRKF